MHLRGAPRSLFLRKLQRRAHRLWRLPWAGWTAREPEAIVKVPPLDAALVSAIKLIAPQYSDLQADEQGRQLWERDQNHSCWAEDAALSPILRTMPTPRRILEIGPGLGRSAIFFSRRYFPDASFDLFDATGHGTKYELLGNRYDDSFCGNLALLQRCLGFNHVTNARVVDAGGRGGRLPSADKYDFIYSFYAVGFHWSLDHWLDEILAVSHSETLCALIVPSHYQPSARIALLPHRLVQASPLLQPDPYSTIYVLVFTPRPVAWLAV
jgi:hypothetical protein